MNSLAIYQNIKNEDSLKAYTFLKQKYIQLIKSRFTVNNCMVEAEERFSFAIVKLYEKIKLDEIQNLTNLHGYFLTTCKNNFLMTASRNKVRFSDSIPEHLSYECETYYEIKDKKEVAQSLINKLPKKLKSISEKIYLEDKGHMEIATELNIKYDNIRKYQYKSIKQLKGLTPAFIKDYLEVA